MKFRSSTLALFAMVLLALPALAEDLTIVSSVQPPKGKPTTSTQYISATKVRVSDGTVVSAKTDSPAGTGVTGIAVCFTKGCYPGQEIVARARYLGRVKRRPLLLTLPEMPALPAGQKVELLRGGDWVSAQPAPPQPETLRREDRT